MDTKFIPTENKSTNFLRESTDVLYVYLFVCLISYEEVWAKHSRS